MHIDRTQLAKTLGGIGGTNGETTDFGMCCQASSEGGARRRGPCMARCTVIDDEVVRVLLKWKQTYPEDNRPTTEPAGAMRRR